MPINGKKTDPENLELNTILVRDDETSSITLKFPDQRDHILRTIRQTNNFYEKELLDASRQFLRSGDSIVDVGSNVGNHAVYWASSVECQVFAFEPVPQIFDCLIQNIVANQLETRIFPNRIAVGSESGSANIESYDALNSGASRISQQHDVGEIPVKSIDSLDFLESQSIRLLKVDVEGMEFDVLKGAMKLIGRDTPVIICECPTDGEFEQIRTLLASVDYIPIECFNATATYLFVSNQEFENNAEKFRSFVMSSTLRNSRFNHGIREALSKQRVMLGALSDKIDKISN